MDAVSNVQGEEIEAVTDEDLDLNTRGRSGQTNSISYRWIRNQFQTASRVPADISVQQLSSQTNLGSPHDPDKQEPEVALRPTSYVVQDPNMGGVDLEQAPYRAIPAGPRDDEAPVLGNAPPATSHELGWRAYLVAVLVSFPVMALMFGPMQYILRANMPAFSVGVAGYEGIDVARPGRVVSPAFNLTLRASKACADRAEVVLTYSGVALGWARVEPRGCVSRGPWGRDVQVVARAGGVGLSRRLRERMASEWRRSGRLELHADVVIHNDRETLGYLGDDTRDKVMRCKVVMADGIQPEPEPCPWYFLEPYRY